MQQEMEYIYRVYQEKNFSKAAEKLFISQPALSMAIKKVEERIGMPLFDRSQRPLALTTAGKAYIEHIQQKKYLEEDLEQQLQDIKDLNKGRICIGGSHYLNAYILPPILAKFSMAYPKIEIELIENSSAALAELLVERQLDITFSCNTNFMMNFERYPAFTDHILLAVPRYEARRLGLEQLALAANDVKAGCHLNKNCPQISIKDFQGLEYIILTKGNNLRTRSMKIFEDAGFEPKIKMELAQLVTAYHMAEASIAATFVSDRLVMSENDQLCYYKLNSEHTTRLFYILLPTKKYTSIAVQTFIKFFTKHSALKPANSVSGYPL